MGRPDCHATPPACIYIIPRLHILQHAEMLSNVTADIPNVTPTCNRGDPHPTVHTLPAGDVSMSHQLTLATQPSMPMPTCHISLMPYGWHFLCLYPTHAQQARSTDTRHTRQIFHEILHTTFVNIYFFLGQSPCVKCEPYMHHRFLLHHCQRTTTQITSRAQPTCIT